MPLEMILILIVGGALVSVMLSPIAIEEDDSAGAKRHYRCHFAVMAIALVLLGLSFIFRPTWTEEVNTVSIFDAELCEEFGIKNTENGFVFSYYGEDGEIVSVSTKELDIEDILFLRKTTVVVEKLEVIHIEDWRVFKWKAEKETIVRYKILRPVEGVKKR